MDLVVEFGKGRGRGSKEGLTRNSCFFFLVRKEGFYISILFILFLVKCMFILFMILWIIFNLNRDRVKGNFGFFFWFR